MVEGYREDGIFIKQEYEGQPEHLGGHGYMTNMDEPLLDFLRERYKVKGFIDLGCGMGGMVNAAIDRRMWTFGIDGDPATEARVIHDFTYPIDAKKYAPKYIGPTLVWSVEFVEHVEERYMPNYMPVFGWGDVILLSHAMPDQFGHHHVNCRDGSYWLGAMAAIGYRQDVQGTIDARHASSLEYTRKNGIVFLKNNQ